MTYEEILEVVKQEYATVGNFAFISKREIDGVGSVEEVDQYGGEGQGDTWYSVKYFPDHDVYIRIDGWHQSYEGTEFGGWGDACSEVRPQQKTITVYE